MAGDIFKVSYSKLSTFRRCRQKYHWQYIQHYYPKSSEGQVRGSAGHAALGAWHRNYNREEATLAAWRKWSAEGFTDGEAWELTERTLNQYYVWSEQNDDFEILQVELKFEIEFFEPNILFVGYIDGIIKASDDRIWLLENKFNKRVQTTYLDMDMQASSYLLAAKLLGMPAVGVLYNIVRVATTKISKTEPVVRKMLYRNHKGLDHVLEEILIQAKEMIAYEEGGEPYRNPTKDCSWDCPFFSACLNLLEDGLEPTRELELACTITERMK